MIDRDPIAREIEKALDVGHSPDLEARIRRRISALPAPVSRSWWHLKLVAATAAAAFVMFAVIPRQSVEQASETAQQVDQPMVGPVLPLDVPKAVATNQAISDAPQKTVSFEEPPAEFDAELPEEVFVGELQSPPVPVFELAIATLPTMSIPEAPAIEVAPIEPFSLNSVNSGAEE